MSYSVKTSSRSGFRIASRLRGVRATPIILHGSDVLAREPQRRSLLFSLRGQRSEMNQVITQPRIRPQARPITHPELEQFVYDDAIVRKFLVAMYVWGVVAFLVGLIIATQLVFPKLSFGLSFFSFGRLRPLHTNAAIFAFAGNAIF